MATKSWPALKSCHNKQCEARRLGEDDDLLSELPEDIFLSIVSSFPMKEAARLSLVSRRCELAWRCRPVLIFEDYHAMEKIENDCHTMAKERSGFSSIVDHVLEKHLGATIDELRITFDLDKNSQSYVDKWAAFALDKQVRRLEFDFSSTWRRRLAVHKDGTRSYVRCEPLDLPPKFSGFKSFLTSLCLRYVNVMDEFVDYLSHSSPLLEILCIEGSNRLTRVTGSFNLKHLEVSWCLNMTKINVSARKLHSFILHRCPCVQLHIVDAPFLSKITIFMLEGLLDVFGSLSEYFSQLVYLNLGITLFKEGKLGLKNIVMPKLEHLELQVNPVIFPYLQGWISLIVGSPRLQKLTLKILFPNCERGCKRAPRNWDGFPLKCLKKLELVGYVGHAIDIELLGFVLENAAMLEDIIVDMPHDSDRRERFSMLEPHLAESIKLTLK